jgi:hypothetical protein
MQLSKKPSDGIVSRLWVVLIEQVRRTLTTVSWFPRMRSFSEHPVSIIPHSPICLASPTHIGHSIMTLRSTLADGTSNQSVFFPLPWTPEM